MALVRGRDEVEKATTKTKRQDKLNLWREKNERWTRGTQSSDENSRDGMENDNSKGKKKKTRNELSVESGEKLLNCLHFYCWWKSNSILYSTRGNSSDEIFIIIIVIHSRASRCLHKTLIPLEFLELRLCELSRKIKSFTHITAHSSIRLDIISKLNGRRWEYMKDGVWKQKIDSLWAAARISVRDIFIFVFHFSLIQRRVAQLYLTRNSR